MACDTVVNVNNKFQCNFTLFNLKYLELDVFYETIPGMPIKQNNLKSSYLDYLNII